MSPPPSTRQTTEDIAELRSILLESITNNVDHVCTLIFTYEVSKESTTYDGDGEGRGLGVYVYVSFCINQRVGAHINTRKRMDSSEAYQGTCTFEFMWRSDSKPIGGDKVPESASTGPLIRW